jgi:hypothetical protein
MVNSSNLPKPSGWTTRATMLLVDHWPLTTRMTMVGGQFQQPAEAVRPDDSCNDAAH